jgi:uncharacterized peroxidase-related enzyme
MTYLADVEGLNQPDIRDMYEKETAFWGYLPNYALAFAHQPEVMSGWKGLIGSIRSGLDPRIYELATMAAARALTSSYCSLAHGKFLADRFYTQTEVARIALDRDSSILSSAEIALMSYAERVATDATSVDQDDIEELRQHGLSDQEIFGIAAAAAARSFFAKLLDGIGAEPDSAFRNLEPELQKALTVGRPIAET